MFTSKTLIWDLLKWIFFQASLKKIRACPFLEAMGPGLVKSLVLDTQTNQWSRVKVASTIQGTEWKSAVYVARLKSALQWTFIDLIHDHSVHLASFYHLPDRQWPVRQASGLGRRLI